MEDVITPDSIFKSNQDQYEKILKNPLYSNLQKQQAKLKLLPSVKPWIAYSISPNSVVYHTLPVPYYKQETNYYCGAATTKQTLEYLNGVESAESQSSIYSHIGYRKDGTIDSKMIEYINNHESKNIYVASQHASESTMKSNIDSDLSSYKAPTILHVTLKGEGWPYNTAGGHFMNLSGEENVYGNILYELTDPYIGWVNKSCASGKYWKSAGLVYQAIQNNSLQTYYW